MHFFLLTLTLNLIFGSTLGTLRVDGGHFAQPNDIPYIVSIYWRALGYFRHTCGGSILSETWIISAADCVAPLPGFGVFKIRAGITDLEQTDYQEIFIKEFFLEPNIPGQLIMAQFCSTRFSSLLDESSALICSIPRTLIESHRITLMKLEHPLNFTERVQPVNLPRKGDQPLGEALVSGWGFLFEIGKPQNTKLQVSYVSLMLLEECLESLTAINNTTITLDQTNFCSGPIDGSVKVCGGDLGGPLVQENMLVGIIAKPLTTCGTIGVPQIYINVGEYVDFIDAKIFGL